MDTSLATDKVELATITRDDKGQVVVVVGGEVLNTSLHCKPSGVGST